MRKLYTDILVIPELLFQYLLLCCPGRRMGQEPPVSDGPSRLFLSLSLQGGERERQKRGYNSASLFLKVTMLYFPTPCCQTRALLCSDIRPEMHCL